MSTKNPNLLLSSLSSESRSLLMSQATSVPLPLRMALYEAEQVPRYAYFPTSGIASVVTVMGNGSTAEVGLIGREGLVGSLHLLGSLPVPTRCFMQLEGSGLRIPMAELKKAFRSSDEIRNRILEFVQEQALGVSQLAACQRLHEAEARLSRWLLMAQDRIQGDILEFTQEFLAMMLSAQRTTVTMVAGALQRSGLIEYKRGRVKILDREKLEEAACDCYQVTKRLYARLYKEKLPQSKR
jgi:CRP-like cAMP-binding protein